METPEVRVEDSALDKTTLLKRLDCLARRFVQREPLKSGTLAIAVTTIALQALTYSMTSLFYSLFGVAPEEVGFSYTDLLGRNSLKLILLVALWITVLSFLSISLAALAALFASVVQRSNSDFHSANTPPSSIWRKIRDKRFAVSPLRIFVTLTLITGVGYLSGGSLPLLITWTAILLILNWYLPGVGDFTDRFTVTARKRARDYYSRWSIAILTLILLSAGLFEILYQFDWLVKQSRIDVMFEQVYNGQPIRQSLVSLNPLKLATPKADLVVASWIGAGETPEPFRSLTGGRLSTTMIWFGQSNGVTVLFDPVRKEVLRLPSSGLSVKKKIPADGNID